MTQHPLDNHGSAVEHERRARLVQFPPLDLPDDLGLKPGAWDPMSHEYLGPDGAEIAKYYLRGEPARGSKTSCSTACTPAPR